MRHFLDRFLRLGQLIPR